MPEKEELNSQTPESLELGVICRKCGKPMANLRQGSLTSWIFGDINCSCGSSNMLDSEMELKALTQATAGPNPGLNLPDRYQFLELIGRGGMAAVFKCRDKNDDRIVAIKLLRPELAADPAAVRRFEQEARAAINLSHRNLVRLFAYGNAPSGSPYLVMEYVDGESLSRIIETEQKLEVKRLLRIILQVCDALQHAHNKGVVHRDLKPSNIIITQNRDGSEEVRLVDFGIAKVLAKPGETMTELTQSGELIGSPLYMSPEQCEGEELDGRSDIYSLGCVMYQCLTGRPPFSGQNIVKIILRHIRETPAPMDDPSIPEELESVIMTCLQKRPEQRYQSIEDVLAEIENLLSGPKQKKARPTSPRLSSPRRAPLPKSGDDDDYDYKPQKKESSGSPLGMVAVVGAVAVIIGGAFFLISGSGLLGSKDSVQGLVYFFEPPLGNQPGSVVIQPAGPTGTPTNSAPIAFKIPSGESIQAVGASGVGDFWSVKFKDQDGERTLSTAEHIAGSDAVNVKQVTETITRMFNSLTKERITAQDLNGIYSQNWTANGFAKITQTWRGVRFKPRGSVGIAPPSFLKVEKLDPALGNASIRVRTQSWINGRPEHLRIQLKKVDNVWKVSDIGEISVAEWLKPLAF